MEEYDGKFQDDEETIYWYITDTENATTYVKGQEMWKRFISFYRNNIIIGNTCIYGTVEKMSTISNEFAFEEYKKLKEQGKIHI